MTHYTDIKTKKKDTLDYFLFNKYVCARIDLGKYEENIIDNFTVAYVSFLLRDFISPLNLELQRRFIFPKDTDVFALVENSTDNRYKFLVYKTNADFLLITLGLFDTESHSKTRKIHTRGQVMDKTKKYYSNASVYSSMLGASRKDNIYEMLSQRVEECVDVLAFVGGDFGMQQIVIDDLETMVKKGHYIDLFDQYNRKLDEFLSCQDEQKKQEIKQSALKIGMDIKSLKENL